MLKGKALFDSVERAGDAFWWLGQHSFVIKLAGQVMLIDPFLTDLERRNVPPLFEASEAKTVDLVLCTHDHLDHIDPVAVRGLAHETEAQFIAPVAHRERMLSLDVPEARLTLLDAAETCEQGPLKVSAIKAAHEFFDQTPEGYYAYLGYVIQSEDKVVYHAGDTVWWEGLQKTLSAWVFDAALVPINGRDAKRYAAGIIGNMTYQEAADLLGGLQVKLSVPTHYDMFDMNREDPQLFLDYMAVKYPERQCWVGQPTECVAL